MSCLLTLFCAAVWWPWLLLGLLGLNSQSTILYFLTAGVYRIPDAFQLYRVSEDGTLAVHPGMDLVYTSVFPFMVPFLLDQCCGLPICKLKNSNKFAWVFVQLSEN
ncbi:hypothetical protein P7K49_000920 [Saguinus oedipus]|uniref:Uncharacterized protein n=1 Tax=Saguinus oedipus TaxID=9490 RepID=A0ABQ9WD04_SAGOE|nr:hypothetical protein P7K49_000920 [Saguinus oedipus]